MTTASFRSSNSVAAIGLALGVALLGCTTHESREHGTTSLEVEITAPTDLGSPDMRLPDGDRNVTLKLTAIDDLGQPDTTFDAQVDLYVHFLGTLSPKPELGMPLTTVQMTGGAGTITLPLDTAYGQTLVWVEDTRRDSATGATGVSPALWFRDPFLDDVSRPADETSLTALSDSPLEGKQVTLAASKFGAGGDLVVTGVYAQGYTLSDVKAADKSTPDYGHVFVFSVSRPRSQDGRAIEIGHRVKNVGGGASEFNGFTELNFPVTNLTDDAPDPSILPAPAVIDPSWLLTPTGATGMINLEKHESGLVEVDSGTVCPLDSDFTTYKQWKLDVGFGCGKPINVITAGQVTGFDPTALVGMTLPRVVGTLRAVNIGTFNVWILYPRQASDIVTN
jgi:hypothetical protein